MIQIYAITAAVAVGIGLFSGWGLCEKLRVDPIESKYRDCLEANVRNAETLTNLDKDRTATSKTCSARLAEKDKVIKKLRELSGTGIAGPAIPVGDKLNEDIARDDAVLILLSGMWTVSRPN